MASTHATTHARAEKAKNKKQRAISFAWHCVVDSSDTDCLYAQCFRSAREKAVEDDAVDILPDHMSAQYLKLLLEGKPECDLLKHCTKAAKDAAAGAAGVLGVPPSESSLSSSSSSSSSST